MKYILAELYISLAGSCAQLTDWVIYLAGSCAQLAGSCLKLVGLSQRLAGLFKEINEGKVQENQVRKSKSNSKKW